MPSVTIHVIGIPAAQGSKRHVGGGRLVEMSKTLPAWRKAVAAAAATRTSPFQPDDPVVGTVTFALPRPGKSRFPTAAAAPDLDKLLRALGDGLEQGGLVSNDARIVKWYAEKRWTMPGEHAGAYVTLTGWETP